MKNISKTDKKILNEFEINYLVLLLNASISKLNSNSEIVSDEYSNLIEVLKAFDYVDKNLEKQEKNIDKNYIKKHLNLYYLFLEDEKTIKYQYTYNGYTFTLDAEVDAVQTHNAKDAIKSAWGIDVSVNDDETELSLG